MRRFGIGIALLCLASSGCSKQPTTASTPPTAPLQGATATEEGPAGRVADPVAVAAEPFDANRPWISASPASDYMLIGQSERTFGVWVDVPNTMLGHVPTALALAVDTSGSMRGEKIIHAREAARRLIQELEDGDIVSLVTFSGSARVLLSPTALDSTSRRTVLNLVEELSAEGGTAMHSGLKAAESQLWNAPDTHLVRRVVVISDGQATVGPTDPGSLGMVAEAGLQRSIQVTAIGVGVDYDELTLNALAVRSSGRLHHVEHSSDLP
ncbi:MAG: VWA domain-containing protein, partial [Nannocystaceae bacterium]|nr:VWA domain-containing protein [Nannocystaceae bacterium]